MGVHPAARIIILSMDIFFTNSNEAPVPPEETRIRSLKAEPLPDGTRVKVSFGVTPFQQRPNIEINISNGDGESVSQLSVVEALEANMDFTMHLREKEPGGIYRVTMRLFYSEIDAYEENSTGNETAKEILSKTGTTMDTAQAQFSISSDRSGPT